MSEQGMVYLVGAGPGDVGLITVRGLDCICRADVVVYDNLVNRALLRHAAEDAELIYVGKTPKRHTLKQEEINKLLAEKAASNAVVVRLKGGDPFVFGRGGEEAAHLRGAGIRFEIVPGISSSIAALAYAGIPITHRGVATAFMVITGHEDPTKPEAQVDWKHVADFFGTRVILMGVERIGKIADALMTYGLPPDTPVAMVHQGTTSQQRTLQATLATVGEAVEREGFQPPAVTVIGEVARLREQLAWFEQRPLLGKRIGVTRSRAQASQVVADLTELGAEVLEIPTIRIEPPRKLAPLKEAIASIGIYDWIVFTSPNGVDAFFREFFRVHQDIRELGALKIAAIGAVTAEKLGALHLEVDLQPKTFTSEALLAEFKESVCCENLNFLLPRADLADERLRKGLEELGGIVDDLDAYRTVPETEDRSGHLALLQTAGADLVTFTSSSTVNNFCDLIDVGALREQHPQMLFASIGPQTSEAMRERGLPVAVEAETHTIAGLVEAVLQLVAARK